MTIINLPACVVLSHEAIGALKDYEKQKKAGQNPVFHTRNIGLNPDEFDWWK